MKKDDYEGLLCICAATLLSTYLMSIFFICFGAWEYFVKRYDPILPFFIVALVYFFGSTISMGIIWSYIRIKNRNSDSERLQIYKVNGDKYKESLNTVTV